MMASWSLRILALLILSYLALPLIVIIGASLTTTSFLTFPPRGLTFDWYEVVLTNSAYLSAFATSAWLALWATVIAVLLAVPAALAIARYEFPGRAFLSSLLLSSLVLPHLVLGAALLQFGSMIGLTRNFTALLVGHVVIVTPYVLRTVLPLLSADQKTLEDASCDLGASGLATFRYVTLPQIRPGLLSGSLFAFITSFINVELSIFNTTSEINTIPVLLFTYVEYSIDPTIAAVSAATIVAAVIAVVVIDLVVGLDFFSDRGGR
ncbi:ABC transporter permease [Shinella daejeonensis]|uniref:ABC transporter permease n=1 Tax=Shinella daejeonensis TaxID=659017 RepID=UPI0020C7F163|nr:ABC transporter permease [Shinella daejeonensis]MCP8895053.1 ABC transporter permease [Shinella daejeonensis]